MKLHPNHQEDIDIVLQTETESNFFDIPTGREVVYNDNSYHFYITGITTIPSKVYINDEIYDVEFCENISDSLKFRLKDCDKPFLHSFGAVKIEVDINNQRYYSKSIAVMVSNNDINNSVMNMIQFIYDNCEDYLYEEHKHSSTLTGIKESEIVSLEAKIAFLQKTLTVYKNSYQYLKISPYSKLQKAESVDTFDKLQSVSQNTIRYITNHIDELAAVNYDTGIRFNNQYYQPNRILVERNSYSSDVYENQVIVGFLKKLVSDIITIIRDLQERTYFKNKGLAKSGYIDSMYQIFSRSIEKINSYINTLTALKTEYQQLYYFYSKLFDIKADPVINLPIFTPVFRSINAYRQIYQAIHEWFSIGNYDLGKEELLLSFISTSKIYEYYCLIKLLHHLNINTKMELIESKHASYVVKNPYYSDTKYNNTFIFEGESIKLTLFFQPVIYGNDLAFNGIYLFRNTTTNSRTDNSKKGRIYTPDYLIKIEYDDKSDYIILDAKFSTPENVRTHQLQELVYKYLFSVSPLNSQDCILGMYILCGKTSGSDAQNIVHDLAFSLPRTVTPFGEILVMNGTDTSDYNMPDIIVKKIFNE